MSFSPTCVPESDEESASSSSSEENEPKPDIPSQAPPMYYPTWPPVLPPYAMNSTSMPRWPQMHSWPHMQQWPQLYPWAQMHVPPCNWQQPSTASAQSTKVSKKRKKVSKDPKERCK